VTASNAATHQTIKLLLLLLLKTLPLQTQDLNARPDAVKNSAAGKRDTRTQKQSKDYLRPLFKLCKQRAVNPGILANLVKVRVCVCYLILVAERQQHIHGGC
jgi:Prp18 domain